MRKGARMLRFGGPLLAGLILLAAVACGFQPRPAALAGGLPANAGDVPPGQAAAYPHDAIQVAGFGRASGVPDVATLSMGVSVTDETVAEARSAAAGAMDKVISALRRQGILSSDIATSHFRIHPEYDYGPDGRNQEGYTVRNGVIVTLRQTDKVAAVIDAAVAAGGDHFLFNNLDFSFSDTAAMERKAREAAVADMQEKAAQLAEFAGRELGDLKLISEGSSGSAGQYYRGFGVMAESAAFDTPISAGESEIIVTVHGVYELK